MNKYLKILFVFWLFLFMPSIVYAKEYKFDVCKDCEWNESNLEELNNYINNLSEEDGNEDDKHEDKYIINFMDGNYDFSNVYSTWFYGHCELIFGKGNYKFNKLDGYPYLIMKGQGVKETTVETEISTDECSIIDIKDMTINAKNYFGVDSIYYDKDFLNNYYIDKPYISLKNLIINSDTDAELFVDLYGDIDTSDLIIDNVTVKGARPFFINISNDTDRKELYNNLRITNSNFSDSYLLMQIDQITNSLSNY